MTGTDRAASQIGSARAELSAALLGGFETAINTALKLTPATLKNLSRLQGKVIAVELRGLDITLYLLAGSGGMNILNHYAGGADTTLSGTPLAFSQMALGTDASRMLFSGEVVISGDVELGQDFKKILDDIDIDWEEWLSHLSGDIVAHHLGALARNSLRWGKQALAALGLDLGEYLQHENQALPTQKEVDIFLTEVDELRDAVARLAARLERLNERVAS